MRILHVITSLRTGGAERLITDMLPKLHKDSFDVELMIFDGTETQFFQSIQNARNRWYSDIIIGVKSKILKM